MSSSPPESPMGDDARPAYDYEGLVAGLIRYLRLRTTPIGMKLFETVEAMAAVPRIRRPKGTIHTTDQIVAQACRLGWTVGITQDDLVGAQCGAVIGLHPQNPEWLSGEHMAGVWFETPADAAGPPGGNGRGAPRDLRRDGGVAARRRPS